MFPCTTGSFADKNWVGQCAATRGEAPTVATHVTIDNAGKVQAIPKILKCPQDLFGKGAAAPHLVHKLLKLVGCDVHESHLCRVLEGLPDSQGRRVDVKLLHVA